MIKIQILMWAVLLSNNVFAQSIPVSGSAEYSTNTGSISASIGQIFQGSYSDESGSVQLGVQQMIVSGNVLHLSDLGTKISVSPNPTSEHIHFAMKTSDKHEEYAVEIYDTRGQLVKSANVLYGDTEISLADLKKAIYLLKVYRDDWLTGTFRIIKN